MHYTCNKCYFFHLIETQVFIINLFLFAHVSVSFPHCNSRLYFLGFHIPFYNLISGRRHFLSAMFLFINFSLFLIYKVCKNKKKSFDLVQDLDFKT